VGNVLVPHNAHTKTVLLIKSAKVSGFSKYLFFSKNNIKLCTKETKIFLFLFFRPDKD